MVREHHGIVYQDDDTVRLVTCVFARDWGVYEGDGDWKETRDGTIVDRSPPIYHVHEIRAFAVSKCLASLKNEIGEIKARIAADRALLRQAFAHARSARKLWAEHKAATKEGTK